MFGFGKKSKATFKQHVVEFWEWYPTVAQRFFDTIEAGNCSDLAPEVSEFAAKTLPHLAWVFGPGKSGGHSFTVSGEGVVPMQMLADYWVSQAIEIPGWTFYASRQATPPERLKDFEIQLGDHASVDAKSFLIQPTINKDRQAIDIVAWHPALDQVPKEHHAQILFILLDEALGELGTQAWIGTIAVKRFKADKKTGSIATLPSLIAQVFEHHHWQTINPLHSQSVYQIRKRKECRRGDTAVGGSCIPGVIFDFLENDGRLPEDPLEGTGAELAYVAIDGSVIPEGGETEVRGNIEDAIEDALYDSSGGRCLGGAFGFKMSYIDLLLIDGEKSRQTVLDTLEGLQLQGRTTLESFTS